MYKCLICKKEIPKIEGKVICPYCGSRILVKVRPKVIKRVQAR
ncbi:MAG: DNA-directed RNA polymerase subunit P [Candidatus Aenigmarchaeota archaeon]|nr:DNA-directed RNA polymerase subunit P [Candidatus Aenigmarchaeota archaeon]